jgi:dTDP-4-amino-4,6-dideoxygalactose transaminase
MIPFVNLKAQYQSIKPEIDEAIQNVINDCAFIQGKYCQEFEKNFATVCGKPFAIGCSNGTTALELALRAYGVGIGDEVIVPSHTFIATSEVVSILGATPVFAEIEENTYTIDPRDIEKRITSKTKAIIPVHLYGQAADMDAILEIAKKHNLAVIEDCAQAHLAEYKGKIVPVGETGCFSFFPGKNLGAYGDAGAVVTSSPIIAQKVFETLNHGREKSEKYKHAHIGTNYRMDGIQGAVLNVKLKHLPEWTEHRQKIAKLYNDGLGNNSNIKTPFEADYSKHVYHLYIIRTPKRDELLNKLRENEVECGVHYPIPLHLQPAYKNLGYKEGDFPITEKVCKEILSLPICGSIDEESVQKVLSILKNQI